MGIRRIPASLLRPGACPELAEWVSPLLRRHPTNLAACFSWRQAMESKGFHHSTFLNYLGGNNTIR
jgi:hypothetical protein